jgi:hypothetical protein
VSGSFTSQLSSGIAKTSRQTLGRCLEIMKSNQDSRRHTLVPYKHSKLTEIFQNFFNGQGSAVTLICVNPFMGTGFDENSHVMRFAACAREVQTTALHPATRPLEATKIRIAVPGMADEEEFELIEGSPETCSCFGPRLIAVTLSYISRSGE